MALFIAVCREGMQSIAPALPQSLASALSLSGGGCIRQT